MSISREQEEWEICTKYMSKETNKFTSQELITQDDIFSNEDPEVTAFFISHYANLPEARAQASRGGMERNTLIRELEGSFNTDISKAYFNNIIRTYKRKTLPFNEEGTWQPQEQDIVASLIKREKLIGPRSERLAGSNKGDQFIFVLSDAKLKLGNMHIVYQLLHRHYGLKPRKKQMFAKVIKKFINTTTK